MKKDEVFNKMKSAAKKAAEQSSAAAKTVSSVAKDTAKHTSAAAKDVAGKVSDITKDAAEQTSVVTKDVAGKVSVVAKETAEKTSIAVRNVADNAMNTATDAVENINFEQLLIKVAQLPGVRIDRESFLRKQLSKHFADDIVEKAIDASPAKAGLSTDDLNAIAKACISSETREVTAISAGLGTVGGAAMLGTVPADVFQYFGHVVRVLQKLVYLYGWHDLFVETEDDPEDITDNLDDGTANQLILFMGVMFGISAANQAIAKVAVAVAASVEKQLARAALTKGTIYPIVKKVAQMLGIKMTKAVFARGVGKIIPVVGAVASGGITFFSFRPLAKRLQKYLATLPVACPDFYKEATIEASTDIVEIDFSDIEVEDAESDDEIIGETDGVDDNEE